MAKTDMIRKKAAKEFAEFWKDKGDEKQHTQTFWLSLLRDVLGVTKPEQYIDFEKRVKVKGTKFIDAYIANTNVAIEQKSEKIDLDKKELQSDKSELTPYEQAKRYNDNLRYSERSRWIVVSNFREFRIYDMEKEEPEKHFETVFLKDLPKDFHRLQFLVDSNNTSISPETRISLDAGNLVGELYDSLRKQYLNPDEESVSRNLNILCVRIIFCLYAEDAGLFDTKTAFKDYIRNFDPKFLGYGIKQLFKALNTKLEDRDKYDSELMGQFPYVNGGLFAEDIEVPLFTEEIVKVIVEKCATFDWSEISPTIFGAVFESTLNPETRRNGGMHYTSIENIHKVIDPLFLDDLNGEFEEICKRSKKARSEALAKFQKKLGSLKFLDPACGCGNFLTETYLSLRRLENKVISVALNDTKDSISKAIPFDELISVKISQFYGIEINDFAVDVAKTSIWIAESQMIKETEEIVPYDFKFLPLSTSATIVEGNALRMNWATLKNEETPIVYDYIISNPPFIGAKMMKDPRLKEDMIWVFGKKWKNLGNMDYVCCWYKKAVELIKNTTTSVVFVSTNSLCQGLYVAALWKPLFKEGIEINFAWRTFRWDSESIKKAHVHCVIVGFSLKSKAESDFKTKQIFSPDGSVIKAKNINPYLIDAPNVFICQRTKNLCNVPKITFGNMADDDGNFILTEKTKTQLLEKEPKLKKFIREFLGSEEFINGKKRYCLWLKYATPTEIHQSKELYRRVNNVKIFREASTAAPTREKAKTPHLFFFDAQPESGEYIIIPRTSSENRQYIPIGFLPCEIIASDACSIVPSANLYHFGVLTSSVHMAWMRVVCGRLKSDYRYSGKIVYNTFPWCEPNEAQKAKIEKTAQQILDIRAKYPNSSLADLYDKTTMPADLRKAHIENDKAVMAAYGFKSKISEAEIVAELLKMYEKLTK